MQTNTAWKLIQRKPVYISPFVKVYEDKVELPNGLTIADYTVVEKPSVVMIVATDKEDRLIILQEYKYAANDVLLSLPAGHIKKGEQPIECAQRELLEETGFGGEEFEELGVLYDYPTKDLHKVYIIRAKNVHAKGSPEREMTEHITPERVPIEKLKDQIRNGRWKTSSALAAITLSGILF